MINKILAYIVGFTVFGTVIYYGEDFNSKIEYLVGLLLSGGFIVGYTSLLIYKHLLANNK